VPKWVILISEVLMKKLLQKLKDVYNRYRIRELPQSDDALEAMVVEVLTLGGFPVNDSFSHSIATQLMHLNSDQCTVRASSFINTLKRSIANQVAFSMIQDTKDRQKNAKAEQEAAGVVGHEA
jgi:hypothetical protein